MSYAIYPYNNFTSHITNSITVLTGCKNFKVQMVKTVTEFVICD